MRKLTVLVDMDDTIENLMEAWVANLNCKFGIAVKPEEVTDWATWKFFPSLTREQVYAPIYNDEFWKTVKPKPGAPEALRKIQEDSHTIYIVTSSNYETIKTKMECVLFHYFPFLTWGDVIITCNKQIISGDVLIDDGIHNLIGGNYEKLLFDAPHNRLCENLEELGIQRVNNWDEVYAVIQWIANQ